MDELEKTLFDIDSNIGENLTIIDIEDIDNSSLSDAKDMVENLTKFYYNEEFIKQNPNFKKRIDSELESLRILIKMRKSDEKAHDALLNAISSNNTNASLYRSLTEIQKTIVSITTKIGEIVVGLNNMMKGFQLEFNFDEPENESETLSKDKKNTHRGSKEFIKQMMDNIEEEGDYMELFPFYCLIIFHSLFTQYILILDSPKDFHFL